MLQFFSTQQSVWYSAVPKQRKYMRKLSPAGDDSIKEIWHSPNVVANILTNSFSLTSLLGFYFDSYPLDRACTIASASLQHCSFWACFEWSMQYTCSTGELVIKPARNCPALQRVAPSMREIKAKEIKSLADIQHLIGRKVYDVYRSISVFVVYAERYWGVASLKAFVSR